MTRPRSAARSFGVLALIAASAMGVSVSATALADDECPLGSIQKSESGETWCEPTVCDDTAPCPGTLICRPVALCVEIGALPQAPGTKSDAGQRLLVRQRCGADKSCPQRTTCSDKGRCITREQAERAGLLTAAAASNATGSSATPAPASKKSCGCSVPGSSGSGFASCALALLAAAVVIARRCSGSTRRWRSPSRAISNDRVLERRIVDDPDARPSDGPRRPVLRRDLGKIGRPRACRPSPTSAYDLQLGRQCSPARCSSRSSREPPSR